MHFKITFTHTKNIQKYYNSTSQIYATGFNHETSNYNVNITLSTFRRGLLPSKTFFFKALSHKKKPFFFILPTQNFNNCKLLLSYFLFFFSEGRIISLDIHLLDFFYFFLSNIKLCLRTQSDASTSPISPTKQKNPEFLNLDQRGGQIELNHEPEIIWGGLVLKLN